MFRQTRLALITAALAVSAMVAAPAHAQQASGPLHQAAPSFLVTGITTNAAEGQQSSSGSPRAQGFGIGAKIGPLFTSYSGASANFENKAGFEGGIWFGGNRGGAVGVMGEILYAKKKQSVKGVTGSTTLQYLEIPILIRVNVGSRSRNGVSVYGLIGPVFDINLKAKQNDLDVKKNYESLDLGILGGVGVEVTRFLVEARFNKGLKNVLKGGGGTSTDIKTKSFALLFGVRFN